jgi:hypothetical protein
MCCMCIINAMVDATRLDSEVTSVCTRSQIELQKFTQISGLRVEILSPDLQNSKHECYLLDPKGAVLGFCIQSNESSCSRTGGGDKFLNTGSVSSSYTKNMRLGFHVEFCSDTGH